MIILATKFNQSYPWQSSKSIVILHHFLLKPKLEHTVGDENSILFQGDQFLVDEGFLDAVDIGFAAQRIGFSYSLGGET